MALYKRRAEPDGSWWVRFRIGGTLVRRSANTTDRRKAEEYEQALRERYWRQVKLGEEVHTWKEAVDRLKREASWRKNTRETNERSLAYFTVIDHIPIAAIDAKVVAIARARVAKEQSPASTVRILAVFRQVLNACVEWGWIPYAPKVKMPHVPERDVTWLSPEECQRLVEELPAHLRGPCLFCVLTGLRMSNARDLTWDRVDLERGLITVPSSHYKTKRIHTVPISPPLARLLASIERHAGVSHVFTFRPLLKGGKGARGEPRPIGGTFNTKAFRKARERAGVTVRWHDLRHTFASWLAVANASDRVLQSMLGWSSPAMAKRYAHLRTEDLRPWAEGVGASAGTALAVIERSAPLEAAAPRQSAPSRAKPGHKRVHRVSRKRRAER